MEVAGMPVVTPGRASVLSPVVLFPRRARRVLNGRARFPGCCANRTTPHLMPKSEAGKSAQAFSYAAPRIPSDPPGWLDAKPWTCVTHSNSRDTGFGTSMGTSVE